MGIEFLSRLEYDSIVEMLYRADDVEDAWVVGGALLRETSSDIDVIVHTDEPVMAAWIKALSSDVWKVTDVVNTYSPSDSGKDVIIKLVSTKTKARPVDLLLVSEELDSLSITEYMHKYFPLDIQEVAKSLFTGIDTGIINYAPTYITVNSKFDAGKYLDKYRNYYPDAKFVKAL